MGSDGLRCHGTDKKFYKIASSNDKLIDGTAKQLHKSILFFQKGESMLKIKIQARNTQVLVKYEKSHSANPMLKSSTHAPNPGSGGGALTAAPFACPSPHHAMRLFTRLLEDKVSLDHVRDLRFSRL
jgi:hypothetical protein